MLSVAEARARAAKAVARNTRAWAEAVVASDLGVSSPDEEVLTFALHPPTERMVLADMTRATDWVDQWREAERSGAVRVAWVDRSWPSVGTQNVPERANVHGADAIAAFAGAGELRSWRVIRERAEVIRERLAGEQTAVAVASAVRAHATTIGGYAEGEFEELLQVVEWLVEHPVSGRRIRELPIRGIHTKWLERHRKVTEDLYRALSGRDGLGLAESQSLIRIRILDARLRPSGLTDLAVPLAELRDLAIDPRVVFVFENLETVLAMPDLPGAVVVHGGGYAVRRLADVPWITAARVFYWGDLDSDGFQILDRLRDGGVGATSILMDVETIGRYRDLAVSEARPATGTLTRLTSEEDAARTLLQSAGGLRIEQERIPWAAAVALIEGIVHGAG